MAMLSLVQLMAEIAWAAKAAPVTGGLSAAWVAMREAIVAAFLKVLKRELVASIARGVVIGVALQVGMDTAAQAVLATKEKASGRDYRWNAAYTAQAAG